MLTVALREGVLSRTGHKSVADLCVEELALSESELLDRIVDLTVERDADKLLARKSIHYVAELTHQLEMVDRRQYVHRRHAKDTERAREQYEAAA